jgi:hypothetical protein
MPFVTGGDLCLVYSCRPFTVLRFEPSSAQLETIVEVATDYRFSEMRGGSQGLAVDEGYLFVGHQVFYAGNLRRYAHRFISVGPTLAPTGISPPFSFVGAPIEFCAGIAWRGNNIVLSFGINDARAALAEISLDAVVELLEPLAGS